MFITCRLNESEESNVNPRFCNIGTKLIAVSLILIDLGKCFCCQFFLCKKYGFGFVVIHLQFVVEHPCLYIGNTLFYAVDCVHNFTIYRSVCHLHTFDEKLDIVLGHLIEAVCKE